MKKSLITVLWASVEMFHCLSSELFSDEEDMSTKNYVLGSYECIFYCFPKIFSRKSDYKDLRVLTVKSSKTLHADSKVETRDGFLVAEWPWFIYTLYANFFQTLAFNFDSSFSVERFEYDVPVLIVQRS